MFEIINELTESKVFRSKSILERYSDSDLEELLYMYMLALCIMVKDSSTQSFANEYIIRATMYRNFDSFRNVINDLYVLGYSQRDNKYFRQSDFIRFMTNIRYGNHDMIYQQLKNYQRILHVRDLRLRDLMRVVSHWETASEYDKNRALRILIREIYLKTQISELLPKLRELKYG